MATLELEHCIGGLFSVSNALHIKNNDIISIAGAQVFFLKYKFIPLGSSFRSHRSTQSKIFTRSYWNGELFGSL
jgi:hypothetical protein